MILFYHISSFLLIIDLYFLVPAVFVQTFNSVAELVIPIGILSEEEKGEIEIRLVIEESETIKCSI